MYKLPERFTSKIDVKGECWNWKGASTPNGYGIFTVMKRNIYAHRFAWMYANGGPIPEGIVICHKCDNPSCVNPDHLFAATQKENLDDMKAKNRSAKGEKHRSKTHPELVLRGEQIGNSKLTSEQVAEIRKLYKRGTPGRKSEFSLSGLARKYGVGFQTISRIVNGERWV